MVIICFISYLLDSSIFIGGIVIGILISMHFLDSKKNKIIAIEKEKNNEFEEELVDLRDKISNLLREAEEREIELIKLNNNLKILNQDIQDGSDTYSKTLNSELLKETSGINSQETILFFSIPSDNTGRFYLSNKKESYDTKCHYSIKVLPNNQGELSYLSSDKDFRALDDYISHLVPVCDILNFTDKSNAKNIQMVKKGIVNFENGSWVIDKNNKVKIRFI